MTRVLFVCLGNICRSPAAEGVVAHMAEKRNLKLTVDSAGTSDWHLGSEPYEPMQEAAGRRGYDLSALRARQFCAADFEEFDLIIGMDAANNRDMNALRPSGNDTPVRLFLDFAPDTGVTEVPDPYYTRDYERALDLIESAADGLVADIASHSKA